MVEGNALDNDLEGREVVDMKAEDKQQAAEDMLEEDRLMVEGENTVVVGMPLDSVDHAMDMPLDSVHTMGMQEQSQGML